MDTNRVRTANNLFRSGSVYAIATAAPLLTHVAITPIVVRTLSPTDYGYVAAAFVTIQLSMTLLSLGITSVVTRHSLIEKSGESGARFIALTGGLTAVFLGVVLAPFARFPIATAFGMDGRATFALAIVSGGLFAAVSNCQAFFRAVSDLRSFVMCGFASGLVGPFIGLVLIRFYDATDLMYVVGLAAGHALSLTAGVILLLRRGRPRVYRQDIFRSLAIGLPTIPHQAAIYLATGAFIAMTGYQFGPSAAGRIQIAFLVDTTPIVVLSAFNNSWATIIYGAHTDRMKKLASTSYDMVLLAVTMATFVAALAPWLAKVLTGSDAASTSLTMPIGLFSASAVLVAIYLSNAHLIFVSGQTRLFVLLAPFSLVVGVAVAVLSVPLGPKGIAIGHPTMWLAMAILSSAYSLTQGWQWPRTRLMLTAAAAFTGILLLAMLPSVGVAWVRGLAALLAAVSGLTLILTRLLSGKGQVKRTPMSTNLH